MAPVPLPLVVTTAKCPKMRVALGMTVAGKNSLSPDFEGPHFILILYCADLHKQSTSQAPGAPRTVSKSNLKTAQATRMLSTFKT